MSGPGPGPAGPGGRDAPIGAPPACASEVCITCSDEGRVVEIGSLLDQATAEVAVDGRVETVDVSLVEPVEPGDLVLVHAGVAISTVGRNP